MLQFHTKGLLSPWCGTALSHKSCIVRAQHSRCLRVVCFSSSDDLYSILSVPATASQAEIKAAYRKLVHDLHPDKHAHKPGKDTSMAKAFLRCKKAYEVLSDCEQRRQYDEAVAAAGGYTSRQANDPPPAQAWSPYNGWMDAYNTPSTQQSNDQADANQHTSQHTADYHAVMQQAAAATAAAGANSSGLSDYKDPLAAAVGGADASSAAGADLREQQTSAAVRAALLDEHGLALEQFGSLQDALAALAERDQQQTVVGLAEGDYDNTWQL